MKTSPRLPSEEFSEDYENISACTTHCEQSLLSDPSTDALAACHASIFVQLGDLAEFAEGIEIQPSSFCPIFDLTLDNCASIEQSCGDHCEGVEEVCDSGLSEQCLPSCTRYYVQGLEANIPNPLACIQGALTAAETITLDDELASNLSYIQACAAANPLLPSGICSFDLCDDLCSAVALGCLDHPIAREYSFEPQLLVERGIDDLQRQISNCRSGCQTNLNNPTFNPNQTFNFHLSDNTLACRTSFALIAVEDAPLPPPLPPVLTAPDPSKPLNLNAFCAYASIGGGGVCTDNEQVDLDNDGLTGVADACPYVHNSDGSSFNCDGPICTPNCMQSFCAFDALDCNGDGDCSETSCSGLTSCGPAACGPGLVCLDEVQGICSGPACGTDGYRCLPGETCEMQTDGDLECEGPPCGPNGDNCRAGYVCNGSNTCAPITCGDNGALIACPYRTVCLEPSTATCSGEACGEGLCSTNGYCHSQNTGECRDGVECGDSLCLYGAGCFDDTGSHCGGPICNGVVCHRYFECVADECADPCPNDPAGACRGNQVCSIQTGLCVDSSEECGAVLCYPNAECVGGYCEGPLCGAPGARCLPGQECDTGVCRYPCGPDGSSTLCAEGERCNVQDGTCYQ